VTVGESSSDIGRVLAGRYLLEEEVGRGGMGVVFRALDQRSGSTVAVKTLRIESGLRSGYFARFRREVKATVRIASEHVARVLDVGADEDGRPFMVMEFLPGEDLAAALERGPLSLDLAITYMLHLCHAVGEAHSRGIIHRDIKPSNVFLVKREDRRPMAKMLDFGVSKVLEDEDSITATNATLGSPLYMAPEQMANAKEVDHRADIWSLGVILYQMISGRRPFFANNFVDLIQQIRDTKPTPLSELVPKLPKELDEAVARCLSPNVEERYQHVPELASALALVDHLRHADDFDDDAVTEAIDPAVFRQKQDSTTVTEVWDGAKPPRDDRRGGDFAEPEGTQVMSDPARAAALDALGRSKAGTRDGRSAPRPASWTNSQADPPVAEPRVARPSVPAKPQRRGMWPTLLIALLAFVAGALVVALYTVPGLAPDWLPGARQPASKAHTP
jgi:serine/threonine-protein kinase